jgi:hypothetical protein
MSGQTNGSSLTGLGQRQKNLSFSKSGAIFWRGGGEDLAFSLPLRERFVESY